MLEKQDNAGAKPGPDEISQRIMADINTGVLRRGEWLKQIDLERRYSCTRVKVRDALTYLHSKRLVEHIHNRGYRVPDPNPVREREIGEVRALLEAHAAADVLELAAPEDVARMRQLAEAFREAAYNGTSFSQIEANYAFHAVLYGFCRNEVLRELILDLRQQGPAAPVGQWQTVAQLQRATQDHFDIVDAIERRDLDLLRKRITAHIAGKAPQGKTQHDA
ncbi:GntR family transcriptional regulator [Leisingera sp.]|uniref:GntR family transcriptional regulator n=1 Tax=Leisingera sp. TaxID=1879318 RepID=UPI002B27AA0C|nr:GntR family transcriptional regulator [Leisingera sp.]